MAMAKIFKCICSEGEAIPREVLERFNISYEDANKDIDKMVMVSRGLKEYEKGTYCTLPFCHTVEPEALGSTVIFDAVVGNRIGKYAINDIDSILNILTMNLNDGRISKVLQAIKRLKDEGEKVRLDVTGPLSIATSIMDTQLFYKAIRKDREMINKLLEILEDNIVEYIIEGVNKGVDIISFADPTGTIDIVGSRLYEDISGKSTYNILKRIENQLGDSIVHLCGKTSTSLEVIGLLDSEKIKMDGNSYSEMIINLAKERKDIKFIGHWCMKLDKAINEITCCRLKDI